LFLGLAPCPPAATTSLQPSDTARRKNRTFTRANAAFGRVREHEKAREKAGWTNDLHYPIELKITRRNRVADGEKRLRGKDLQGNDRPVRHDLMG